MYKPVVCSFQHEKRDSLNVMEKDRKDFDIMLELRLEKQQRIERDLRRSLEVGYIASTLVTASSLERHAVAVFTHHLQLFCYY